MMRATAPAGFEVHAHRTHEDCCDQPPLWRRTALVDTVAMRRLGLAMLAVGALLAYSPLHPGLICPLRSTTGVPCPFCGMTTSVKACLQGDLGAALAANPGGVAAVLGAIVLLAWRPRSIKVPIAVMAVGVSAMWVFQLFRFSVL